MKTSIIELPVDLDPKLDRILKRIISGLTFEEVKTLSDDDHLNKLIKFLEENLNELKNIYSERKRSEKECNTSMKKFTAENEHFPDFSSMSDSLRKDVERVLSSSLPEQEMEITRLYFGIGCENVPIKIIAKTFGISQKSVRMIRDNAISQMRESKTCLCLLKEYLGR